MIRVLGNNFSLATYIIDSKVVGLQIFASTTGQDDGVCQRRTKVLLGKAVRYSRTFSRRASLPDVGYRLTG